MMGTTLVPKGSVIIVMPGAANTDPDRFENGCKFNMERNNNRQHMSFGKGSHFCIGAPLARMQVHAALKSLIEKAVSIDIPANQEFRMVTDRDNGIFRFEELLVRVE
jgi:cytochrome P450